MLFPSPDAALPEGFHEWRKHAKYHGYHLHLLRPVWPEVVKNEQKAADALGELLGDDHDLAVLSDTLATAPTGLGDRRHVEILLALAA